MSFIYKVEHFGAALPVESPYRIDFYPNGGTIKSIRGYESSKIYAGSTLAQEQNIFVDRNSGIGMIMTGKTGQLDCFPVIERDGYTFDGWYKAVDAPDGGTKVELSERFTADAGLTAKWTKAGEASHPVEVWFHLGGGKVTSVLGIKPDKDGMIKKDGEFIYSEGGDGVGHMLTGNNGKLPALPVAARDGYEFDGWYTAKTGGTKVTAATVFTGSGQYGMDELYAHWTTAKDTCTVSFQLNGAPGTPPADMKVAKGSAITLPENPKWEGHTFLCWMSGTLSGSILSDIVYWTDGDKVNKDVTLFAKWADGKVDDTLKGLTYRFGNNAAAFGYPEPYHIPLERYQAVFGDTSEAQSYYEWDSDWDGSCYGMAATSGMFYSGSESVSSFRSGATVPFDLAVGDASSSLKMDLTAYIEAVFLSQHNDQVQADYRTGADLSSLCTAADAVGSTKAPVMIAIFGAEGGHAVLGYDVEETSAGETRLMVYDPNFPGTERYITLQKSGSGYTSWYYKMNDKYDWGTGYPESTIHMVPYDHYAGAWAGRAKPAGASAAATLYLDAAQADIIDAESNAVIGSVKAGKLTASSAELYQLRLVGLTSDGTASSSGGTLLRLPAGQYTVKNTGSAGKFKAAMTHVDQSASVTTDASAVTFAIQDGGEVDYVQIAGPGKSYDITLTSTLGKGSRDVKLTGTTSEKGLAFAQISGKLYAAGLEKDAALQLEGKKAETAVISSAMPEIAPLLSKTPAETPKPAAFPFTDVGEGRWYRPYVQAAYEAGLVNGVTPTTYQPDKTLTLAESVTLAARIYAEARGETAPSGGTPWYKAAYDYCVEKGVIDGRTFALTDMTRTATRYEMVSILDGAVPAERMKESVEVARDAIPDLKEADAYGGVVYRWYRAGLIGGDADGSFNGSRDIKRSEMAKILCTINNLV